MKVQHRVKHTGKVGLKVKLQSPHNTVSHILSQMRNLWTSALAIRYPIYFVHAQLICSNEFCHPKPDPDDLKIITISSDMHLLI